MINKLIDSYYMDDKIIRKEMFQSIEMVDIKLEEKFALLLVVVGGSILS